MKVAIGADHGGFDLKEKIVKYLEDHSIEYEDFGTHSSESCDYNDIAKEVATAVSKQNADRGILICGTGIGMSIQANKVEGVRAAHVHDLFSAKATRLHNDSNVLTMGGRIIGDEVALAIVNIWLNTEFSNEERHQRRVRKIESK
ncbi:MAG: ribose 5-phosphate isomerase B [Candidatus Izemoplasmataceae bacterium]|jgi:ribose 5-phosphate isomerase B|uniref:ribose 5-phosphate isomerase B n=1 Tax=Liberiplasma polymorphum TaxID=3374570 RepID=UPI00377663D5